MKLDLHFHTLSRGRAYVGPEELRQALKRKELDGVAITNFFDISHALWLREKLPEYAIIVGQEIWSTEGHVIGLGLQKKIPEFLDAAATVDLIHQQGGLAIAPHPFFQSLGLGKRVASLPLDAIETYNASIGGSLVLNYLARRMAEKYGIEQVAGSDTSHPHYLGQSYTEVLVDKPDMVLEGIRAGQVKLHKRPLPVPVGFILKGLVYCSDIEPCPQHPVPCMICGRSMTARLFKKWHRCLDCGKKEYTRIVCSNGHYLCLDCVRKRHPEDSGTWPENLA